MKIKIYYIRDEHGMPIETVCLISKEIPCTTLPEDAVTLKVVRGRAVCNRNYDQPVKSVGRQLAKGRALECLQREEDVISRKGGMSFVQAEYNPILTQMERKILGMDE